MEFVKPDQNSLTSGLQEAIDSNQTGYLLLYPGEYHIREPLIIKKGIMFISNNKSILINDLNDDYQPFIVIEEYTDIKYLIANSNNKAGIIIGKNNSNNTINIEYMKIYNTGNGYNKKPMKALEINGYNIIINNLDIFLGNVGLSLENASDIRIKEVQIVNCSTGIRMFNANNINIDNFSVDSCYYTGFQMDSTKNSYFKGIIWNNDYEYLNNNNNWSLLIGKYTGDLNDTINFNLRIVNTGKSAIDLSNVHNLYITSIINNKNKIENGITYGKNIKNININGIMNNVRNLYSGKVVGENNILINNP